MPQLENIEAIEKRLWSAADNLRANSNYASNEYFMPVMGLIFLRHAYSRFLKVKDEIEASLPSRGGRKRDLKKEDFSEKSSIFLKPEAQFDYLVSLGDKDDRAKAVITAMESIEADYTSLKGALPKSQYQELDNEVLGQLLRTLNPEELQKVSGDVFGRIYEYFLTQFADQGAHDGGEFFTPISIVSLIANVLEPTGGTVLDPACGSGGMFVQSAHIVERRHENPAEKLTFYGLEKNGTTIELARMNLAVHGLEGNIQKAISYYDDPHEMLGKANFVMANPPFNVDEVDADKVKKDPRLPFGLPGVNKKGKVSNGNYLWISYFHSYLSETGRAGFVMSSQASSAGHGEAEVRRKLVETGDVDVMVSIRSNFFYTRTVPCELWHYDKGKPEDRKDQVLMLDARHVFRKVTRKIYDFTPEQQKNLSAIVWLYRGERLRFAELVESYRERCLTAAAQLDHAAFCFHPHGVTQPTESLLACLGKFGAMLKGPDDCLKTEPEPADVDAYLALVATHKATWNELQQASAEMRELLETHRASLEDGSDPRRDLESSIGRYTCNLGRMEDAAARMETFRHLAERFAKEIGQTVDFAIKRFGAHKLDVWRKDWRVPEAIEALHRPIDEISLTVRNYGYFRKQVHWLLHRFPEGSYMDVPGLCKIVTREDIAAADWSLTPGRYVGVAPVEEDEDFDFAQAMKDIHLELADLNQEAATLAAKIQVNFEGLGV
ncbi:MAG: N-6 DNA methylase [Verrucomicrobiae bacterium]|nr:N-6 DNA methylase [Verrucomicrobiae bacterium]